MKRKIIVIPSPTPTFDCRYWVDTLLIHACVTAPCVYNLKHLLCGLDHSEDFLGLHQSISSVGQDTVDLALRHDAGVDLLAQVAHQLHVVHGGRLQVTHGLCSVPGLLQAHVRALQGGIDAGQLVQVGVGALIGVEGCGLRKRTQQDIQDVPTWLGSNMVPAVSRCVGYEHNDIIVTS